MIRNRQSDDGGFILPVTFAAITLIALAALLTGRVVGTLLRASMQESFAVEEHAVTKTVTGIIDAWIADPQVSTLLVSNPADSRVADEWRTPLGEPCVWGEHTHLLERSTPQPRSPTSANSVAAKPNDKHKT